MLFFVVKGAYDNVAHQAILGPLKLSESAAVYLARYAAICTKAVSLL